MVPPALEEAPGGTRGVSRGTESRASELARKSAPKWKLPGGRFTGIRPDLCRRNAPAVVKRHRINSGIPATGRRPVPK